MKVNKKKIYLCIVFSIIALFGMGAVLFNIRLAETMSNQKKNFTEKKELITKMVDEMEEDKATLTEQYDALYESKSDAISLLGKETIMKLDDSALKEIAEVLNIENSIVIDKNGKILASANPTTIDFASSRFNQLRAVLSDPDSYAPMTVDYPDGSLRFYASKVNKNQIGVICVNTEELQKNIDNNTSLESTLAKIHVGQNGFVSAIDARTYNFLYSPDSSLIGKNAIEKGGKAEHLVDGYEGYITYAGESLYCSVMEKDNVFYILAVPKSEIVNTNYSTTFFGVITLAVVLFLLIAYYIFLQNERTDITESVYVQKKYFDEVIAKKMLLPVVIGIVVVFLCINYLQTLFNLSRQSVVNNARIEEAVTAVENNETETDRLKEEFNENYLEKCDLAAYIIKKVEAKKTLTQDFMIALREALQVEEVWYYDMDGKTIATDQKFWSHQISEYQEDESYDFWMILEGAMTSFVQDPRINDWGEYTQYIGTAMLDDTLHTKGMVLIMVYPEVLEMKLVNNTLPEILKKIQTGNNGFAFAVNKENNTFDYYPDEELMNQDVTLYGMSKSEIRSGLTDFITIDGTEYYATSDETDTDYIYIAVPHSMILDSIFIISLVTSIYAMIVIMFLWYYLCSVAEGTVNEPVSKRENEQMMDVFDGSGRMVRTRVFFSRFNHTHLDWSNQSAGEKLFSLIKYIVTVLSLILLYVLVNADRIFPEDSLIRYILKGSWQKRFNIFSITSCVIVIVVVNVIVVIVRDFLQWISQNANAKAITIIRMIDNFLKFAAVIGSIYYCLGMVGVDTKTLMTSAGILTLIVGLGANSLVNDVISGLFLILEGEFQVGDIVTIDGFRGTVLEIGIRTIKIQEGAGNVKIISNRNASNVLNMTKHHSVVALDMSIEYGENLEYVEYVLKKEFPEIRKKLPAIFEGPFYGGVSALGESSVDIKILCKCKEADRFQLDRDLRRELKLVFDRYGIGIPFPQVVVNKPEVSRHEVPSEEPAKKEPEQKKETPIVEEQES